MSTKRILLSAAMALLLGTTVVAQESATEAIKNMGVGWNLGNTLDSNSGDTNNMWIEMWTQKKPSDYETAWGQAVTTRALIKMFKEAGFNAIRVPVTWYPHMGTVSVAMKNVNGESKPVWDMTTWKGYTINKAWMSRVKEVVDYVIDEGMYCILNVHHDTGDGSTAWLRADETVYEQQKERYEELWKQIANEFKDYNEHLLFESYNEMLDSYGSWCFASFSAPGNYNATVAKSAYNAINKYAQSFVNTVRQTGGNNATRNLVVNTYGCCNGDGTWNSHLKDPLTNMALPKDDTQGHIIFQVHYYPNFGTLAEGKSSTNTLFSNLQNYLVKKGAPVIVGEWGSGGNTSYTKNKQVYLDWAKYFVQTAKQKNIGTFYWMGLSDGNARKTPEFNEADLKDALIKGYYGEGGYNAIESTGANEQQHATYRLDGTRVTAPTRKGIYIIDRKLRVVR